MVFFYEILIKTKTINVCCFQVITNQTNHDYLILMTPIIEQKKYNRSQSVTVEYNNCYLHKKWNLSGKQLLCCGSMLRDKTSQ